VHDAHSRVDRQLFLSYLSVGMDKIPMPIHESAKRFVDFSEQRSEAALDLSCMQAKAGQEGWLLGKGLCCLPGELEFSVCQFCVLTEHSNKNLPRCCRTTSAPPSAHRAQFHRAHLVPVDGRLWR
jgi:hypothetical protein